MRPEPPLVHDTIPAGVCRRAAGVVAAVAGAFLLILGALLVATLAEERRLDPLNSPALSALIERLDDGPDDEALRREIQALDLVSRRAFFTSVEQMRAGGWLLGGGAVVLAAALGIWTALSRRQAVPGEFAEASAELKSAFLSRRLISGGGLALAGAAVLLAWLTDTPIAPGTAGGPGGAPVRAQTDQAGAGRLAAAEQWPGFRGPNGNGVALSATPPAEWNGTNGMNVAWKAAVPRSGFSSPVVWGRRIFLTGGDREVREVYCFDSSHGELLWVRPVVGIPGSPSDPPETTSDTGVAAPTPATDGVHVFAMFATGDLVCLEMDGRVVWGRNLGVPDNHYGHASSPIAYGDLLLVQFDDNTDARVMGLEIATGRTVWETERGMISWSSPICVNTGKRMELILTDGESVCSYAPGDGVLLWRKECLDGEVGPSAAYGRGMVFAANEYAVATGIKLSSGSSSTQTVVAWEWDGDLPSVASPATDGRRVYFASSGGVVSCLDATTGKLVWRRECDEGFYASPILAGDRVYALDLGGRMHVFRAGERGDIVAESPIGERCFSTPAFVGDRIYIRGEKHLFCVAGGT